jgi:hypothetical protein
MDGFYSPTYTKNYDIGSSYHCFNFRSEDTFSFFVDENYQHDTNCINYFDGFHLCLTRDDAINYMKVMVGNSIESLQHDNKLGALAYLVIAKCSVPRGGYYIIGEDDMYHIPGLVCSDVKLEEIVNTFVLDENLNFVEEQKSNSAI